MKTRIFVLLVVFFVFGCATKFSRVDFKYSNLAYMSASDAFVTFEDLNPEDLIFALSDAFRARSFAIINRKRLNYYYIQTPEAEECSKAGREIFQQEFLAYQQNNFQKYKAIDRETPFSNRGLSNKCKQLKKARHVGINSWFLEVEVPQGDYSTTVNVPDVSSFFIFDGSSGIAVYGLKNKRKSVSTSFASRLYIWAWQAPGTDRTEVYLEAKPVNGQVVACNGCSIGHSWWRQTNGYAEFKLVRHYVLLLEELKHAENILKKINEGRNRHDI